MALSSHRVTDAIRAAAKSFHNANDYWWSHDDAVAPGERRWIDYIQSEADAAIQSARREGAVREVKELMEWSYRIGGPLTIHHFKDRLRELEGE